LKPSSAKAKGRRLQNNVADLIREAGFLADPDVRPAIMGETGMDVKLSTEARGFWPYAMELKNTERLNIWSAIAQASAHAEREQLKPMVVFSRNREREPWCAVPLSEMLRLRSERE
jgi:hypothetical protein